MYAYCSFAEFTWRAPMYVRQYVSAHVCHRSCLLAYVFVPKKQYSTTCSWLANLQAMSDWNIRPGSRVLVHAGSSGVGTWVVQTAKVRTNNTYTVHRIRASFCTVSFADCTDLVLMTCAESASSAFCEDSPLSQYLYRSP